MPNTPGDTPVARDGAMDFGRQRHLLAQAQQLSAEIRASPLDAESVRQSFPKLVELVRIVKRFIESTSALPADGTKAMWEQRGQWLQEEVAALAQERIYSPDQQQYWLNLVLLLFAGADACDKVLRQKAETEVSLKAASDRASALEARVRQLEAEPQQRQQMSAETAEEVLQLRSKAVVLQQELDKHQAQAQALAQQLQMLLGERDALQRRVDELQIQTTQLQELSDGQQEVIRTMMVKAEGSQSQSSNLAQDNAQLQAHCKTLSANLETNAQVIEKLIELNSELMESLNRATTARQKEQAASKEAAAAAAAAAAGGTAGGTAAGTAGAGAGAPGHTQLPTTSGFGSLPGQGGYQGTNFLGGPPGSAASSAGGAHPASASMPYGLPNGSASGHYAPPLPGDGTPVPSTVTTGASLPPLPVSSNPGPVAAPQASLAAAFEAFLTEDPPAAGSGRAGGRPLSKTSAELLALPPAMSSSTPGVNGSAGGGSGAGGKAGGGRGGIVGGLWRYVAGTPPPSAQLQGGAVGLHGVGGQANVGGGGAESRPH